MTKLLEQLEERMKVLVEKDQIILGLEDRVRRMEKTQGTSIQRSADR